MIQDDLWAGRSIAVLLATLVAVGVILALLTVVFVSGWPLIEPPAERPRRSCPTFPARSFLPDRP